MSALNIDRITLILNGVPATIASAAIEGLDAELTRRLSVRGLDVAAMNRLAPTLRLPTIEAGAAVDAETLRGLIADGLMAVLSPRGTVTSDREAD